MAFFEYRLNTDLSFGAKGGPVFSTSKAYSVSGRRQTNQNWTYPLQNYDISHCVKTKTDYKEIINLFYNVNGAYDGFRFKDHHDYEDDGDGILTLISGSNYQMFKNYVSGSRTFTRKIQKPVVGIQIFRTRASVTTNITGASTIDTTTGIVGVTSHLGGDTYTWTGEFDVPVAFSSDEFMPMILDKSNDEFLIQGPPITLEEIRL